MTNNEALFYAKLNALQVNVVLDALCDYSYNLAKKGNICDDVKSNQAKTVMNDIYNQLYRWANYGENP